MEAASVASSPSGRGREGQRDQLLSCLCLRVRQRHPGVVRVRRLRQRLGRQRHRFQGAVIDEAIDDAERDAGLLRQRALAAHDPIGGDGEHLRPRARRPGRGLAGGTDPDACRLGAGRLVGQAKGHGQRRALRRQCVAGEPVDEFPQRLGQGQGPRSAPSPAAGLIPCGSPRRPRPRPPSRAARAGPAPRRPRRGTRLQARRSCRRCPAPTGSGSRRRWAWMGQALRA